jgi:DinB superfamily
MRAPRLALCTIALLALTTTARAQDTGGRPAGAGPGRGMMMQRMKDDLVSDLERQRKNLLDYVNVAPDSMLRFRSTPGVRTYAQQIHHAASVVPYLVGTGLGATLPAEPTDTARLFSNKAALRDYVNAAYDYAVKTVREAQPPAFMAEKTIFGMTRNGTRWVHGALEHGTWTLGQTVPYLRMNGVTPPNYLPF